SAEERAFERAVSMDAAAAEAADLARRVQARQRAAVRAQRAAVEVRLDATERLAGEDAQSHSDERSGARIEHPVRPRDADQAVGDVAARVADRRDLRVARRPRE